MAEPSFRCACDSDQEAILEVVATAFQFQPGTPKWQQACRLVRDECQRFHVMFENGRLIGTAYLCRLPIQVGCCELDLGYIGQVAIIPEMQGQGRGTRLIGHMVEVLQEQNYDLARLSGLVRFYRRFGWTPFPRRFVEFPLRSLRAGTVELGVADLLMNHQTSEGTVRRYRSSTDRQRREELVRRFNYQRTGASARAVIGRSRPLHHDDPDRWRFVYEQDGQLYGYVATHVFPDDVSDFESAVNLYDVAFDLDQPQAVVSLLKYVLWLAYQRDARRVTARLPWDQRLFGILQNAGMVFEQVELMNAATGNMLRIVDLPRLVQKILPELCRRWGSGQGLTGILQLIVEDHRVSLSLQDDGLRIVDGSEFAWQVRLKSAEFLRMLLGLAAPRAIVCPTTDPTVVRILEELFPVQPTASTNWG